MSGQRNQLLQPICHDLVGIADQAHELVDETDTFAFISHLGQGTADKVGNVAGKDLWRVRYVDGGELGLKFNPLELPLKASRADGLVNALRKVPHESRSCQNGGIDVHTWRTCARRRSQKLAERCCRRGVQAAGAHLEEFAVKLISERPTARVEAAVAWPRGH